jgi:hypothetical protein
MLDSALPGSRLARCAGIILLLSAIACSANAIYRSTTVRRRDA